MLKLSEQGLYTSPAAKGIGSHFAGFILGNHNQNDGVKWSRSVRLINVATNPAAAESIVVGTKTYTFVASGATGDQINIGGTAILTAANICAKINADQAFTSCTAYVLATASRFILVDNRAWVTGQVATPWTDDGIKVLATSAWIQTLNKAGVENLFSFKIALTAEGTVPVDPLTEHYYDAPVDTAYQNFLY